MSELRQDILTGNWTVMAPERGKKPVKLKAAKTTDIRDYPPHDNSCPFCPGNEEKFEIKAVDKIVDNAHRWVTKTIENKYKLFDNFSTCPVVPEAFCKHGIYSYYQGCGNHYLVIEHKLHNKVMGNMKNEEIYNVFSSYIKSAKDLKKNPNNLITIIFKNQGANAGGSQPHAHSQIVGSRIVPAWIRNALHIQEKYFDDHGSCPMCTLIAYEVGFSKRVVAETDHVVALSPYAAGSPYEIWVIPKRHFACFIDMNDSELRDISSTLRTVLNTYVLKLSNPDFNYFFHSSPYPLASVPYSHMYIQIVPRMKSIGGFEIGTKIPVNHILPEEAVKIFKI